jgi:hypothetical protein
VVEGVGTAEDGGESPGLMKGGLRYRVVEEHIDER